MPRLDNPAIRALIEAQAADAAEMPSPAEWFAEEARLVPEAAARKQRSLAVLRREGVPINAFLPLIETEADIPRRATEEVALRALALLVVAVKGATADGALARAWLARLGVADALTPKERAFIDDPAPVRDTCVQFSWRYECLWVLLWALGFEAALGRPDRQMDVDRALGRFAALGREGFLAQARLRPAAELLDAADLLYRYHWAIREAQIREQAPPPGLNPDVVPEWHRALNWLIGYGGAAWDEVATDT
jgi:hypothetical protein